jgi:hypothetical protein
MQLHTTQQHGLVSAALAARPQEEAARAPSKLRATGSSRKKS